MRFPFILVVFAVCLTGCLPMEPQWLPDSSGLVYTKPGEKGELKHLDLENKRHRVMATIPNCVTSPPGVSPKGDRFAVIENVKGVGADQVKVQVFDLAGDKIHSSPALDVQSRDPNSVAWNAVNWSPVDDKLLLWVDPPQIYDMETGKFSALPKGFSLSAFCLLYRVSPFLPDGSGILVQRDGAGEKDGLSIFTWDGKTKTIEGDFGGKEFKPQGEQARLLTPTRWKGNVLRIELDNGYAVVDATTAKMVFEPSEALAKLKDKDQWCGTATFASGARVIARRLPSTAPQEFAVDLIGADGATKVLAKQVFSGYGGQPTIVSLFPSPDGKQMAIKYAKEDGGAPRVMIVDEQGKVLKDVEL